MEERCGIYVRLSQDREGAGLGVDRQEEQCRELADRLGLTVGEVYSDNDISASKGRPRSGYLRLLADVGAGRVGTVLVWHTDRLHRSPAELETWIDAANVHNVGVHAVVAGPIDLATPTGRMVARILGATARFEAEHLGERVSLAQDQAVRAGRSRGGRRPFGFTSADGSVVPHPTEAPLIPAAVRDVLAGTSLGAIAASWTRQGFTGTAGSKWDATTVRQVLVNPRVAGLIPWRGDLLPGGPALVPEDEWRGLVALLATRARGAGHGRVRHLLSGIAECGVCGGRMTSAKGGKGGRLALYRCCVYVVADQADEHVREVMRLVLSGLTVPAPTSSTSGLGARAAALRAQRDEVEEQMASLALGAASGTRILARIAADLADVEARMAAESSLRPQRSGPERMA